MAKTNYELECQELRKQLEAANKRLAQYESQESVRSTLDKAIDSHHRDEKKKLDTKHPHA